MEVTLFDYTGAGSPDPAKHAATVLIFTKSTRLEMSPNGFQEISEWTDDRRMAEIEYMANTIPSSHEFCRYSFLIRGVTRAFTHQLVRTRNASYAQQAMRIVDMTGFDYLTPPEIQSSEYGSDVYGMAMNAIEKAYAVLIENGIKAEDARGILPTNILTNICMSIDLRNLCDLIRKRSSLRVQDEYRSVVEAMKAAVLKAHPFARAFLDRGPDRAASDLQMFLRKCLDDHDLKAAIKMLDQVRGL